MNDLTYDGYTGSVEVSFDDNCLHGRILFITDLVTYEADSPAQLQNSFQEAVDRYVEYCEKNNKIANKPFSGTFNVRTGAELHKKATIKARQHGQSLNEFVIHAISDSVNGTTVSAVSKAIELFSSSTLYTTSDKQESKVLWSKV